jgi:hypothetical protein
MLLCECWHVLYTPEPNPVMNERINKCKHCEESVIRTSYVI